MVFAAFLAMLFHYYRGKAFLHGRALYCYSDIMVEATVEEIAGFISGNVKRKQVLDVLDKNGSKTFDALRKITRMPKIILEKVLKDMTEYGVVEKQNGVYTLTEHGKKVAGVMPKGSAKSGGHLYDSNVQHDI
jgi:DNA-binding HxlR family transcriptional regulator